MISALQEDATKRQKKNKKVHSSLELQGTLNSAQFYLYKVILFMIVCFVMFMFPNHNNSFPKLLPSVSPSLTPSCLYITLN